MKKIVEFVVYLFYNYYNKGATKSIAYPSALMGVSLLLYINVSTIVVALGVDYSKISPVVESCGRGVGLLSAFLLWLPFFLILKLLLNKKEIQNKNYSNQKIKIGNLFVLSYVVMSMALLMFLIAK
jgi:hypothetical protein